MSQFAEDPFQMDEDFNFGSDPLSNENPGGLGDPHQPKTNIDIIDEEIRSPYDSAMKYETMYNDNELIRSKVAQLKLQEVNLANPNNNTTEEDEEVYDEDLYDKFDPELQAQLERDYKEQLQKQNEVETVANVGNFNMDIENSSMLANTKNHIHGSVATEQNNSDLPLGLCTNKDIDFLTPPENFAPVINKIYRSSFPQPNNFTFMKKLKLKAVLCLIPEDYPELNLSFLKDNNIKLFQLGMSGNKEPFVKISSELITEAIKIVINPENQPILIHCNRGKHRTGCLVGVLRRLQKWSMTIIFDEYRKFASPKERPMDQQFIELYDERDIVTYARENNFLPLNWG